MTAQEIIENHTKKFNEQAQALRELQLIVFKLKELGIEVKFNNNG